jgi:eukaryotic-like serine/threonine-protein kinase
VAPHYANHLICVPRHWAVGGDYVTMNEPGRASEYYAKAFQLREHASERGKLAIGASYYENVTGELDKAAQTYQQGAESYPRHPGWHLFLGNMYAEQGQYEKARESYSERLRLAPDNVGCYETLTTALLALQRFEDARQTIRQA